MYTEVVTILGLSEYPGIAAVISCVTFLFIVNGVLSILWMILKEVGGFK